MGHFIGPEVTSGTAPAIHAGLNTKVATANLAETASGSVTIAMCKIPAGAIVTNVDVTHSALDTSGGGTLVVQAWIGGSSVATYFQSATAADQIHAWNPAQAAVGYRLTSSAQLVIGITQVSATGTGSMAFTTVLQYTTTEDPD